MKNTLKKIDGRKIGPEGIKQLRLQVVRLHEQGYTGVKISKITGLTDEWVSRVLTKYRTQGLEALEPQKRGRASGSNRTLKPDQEQEIRKLLEETTPEQHNLPCALWSRSGIQMLIEDRFKITMPLRTISLYLNRWNFSYQRPLKRSYAQQPEVVQKWLDEEYPRIAETANQEGGHIYWCDETGIRNESQNIKGFSPVGQTPVLHVEPKRYGLNMISAVTNLGEVRFMLYGKTMTSGLFIQFLSRLLRCNEKEGRIHVILDNLRVHRSKKVCEWLEKHKGGIQAHYLPAYSPELNPDEYLNNHLKQEIRKKRHARTLGELQGRVMRFMRKLSHRRHVVKSYFMHKMVAYAA